MPIRLPSQLGIVFLKSDRTTPVIERLRTESPHLFRGNEDTYLAGCWLSGSSQHADQYVETIARQHRLRSGIDFVLTDSGAGIIGRMPDWLQEDEGTDMFSVPGTGGSPRTTARLTMREQAAQWARERRIEKIASWRDADALASRRWPDMSTDGLQAFLKECLDLVEFVEAWRAGGAARRWVEAAFPAKRWHIGVNGGYENELRDLLQAYDQSGASPAALVRLRRRAGQYVMALEAGAAQGTVDLECLEAWKRSREDPQSLRC
jgi:hypothetical protein